MVHHKPTMFIVGEVEGEGGERYGRYSREVREREKGEQNEEKVIITKIKSTLYEP